MDKTQQRLIILLILACICVYFLGAFKIRLIDIDAAQYANIGRVMLTSHQYLELFDRGKDYLDKPPMLLWLGALSMRVFGVRDVAYRLPSELFAVLAIYSTYRFALLFYKREIALLSALVLAGCQGMFLMTHDVKTDTMLMGWVILSIWQLAEWFRHGSWRSLLLSCAAIAGGMLTKGPIALMVPVFAFLPHFLLRRSFKELIRWQYLLMLAIVLVLLLPMDVGLYRQFDLHPEKTVNGLTGVSGLRFYYWTQSFGRITGESPWHNNHPFYFLAQNLLWSFLPWVLFFYAGLAREAFRLLKGRFRIGERDEWISAGGFLVTYCALASSRYQLPDYLFVVFPLAAVITGKFLWTLCYTDELRKWRLPLYLVHAVLFLALFIALLALLYWPFPSIGRWPAMLALFCAVVFAGLLLLRTAPLPRLLLASVFTVVVINMFLDGEIYPAILNYETGVAVSRVIDGQHLPKDRFFRFDMPEDNSLEFYAQSSFSELKTLAGARKGDYVLAPGQECESSTGEEFKVVYRDVSRPVDRITIRFLNPKTRSQEVTPYCILERI